MMTWLIQIVTAILRILLPAILQSREPTCEDAQRQPELRRRLQGRIRETWGRAAMIAVLVFSLLACAGCGRRTRTIYVPPGEPVRLRQTVRNVRVWIVDKDGKPVAGQMDLPEGWYCLPMPEPKDE